MRMAGRVLALLTAISWTLTGSARAQLPNPSTSYFVVQTGAVATPTEGPTAIRLLRLCPNNDGISSLPNHVRLKIKLIDGGGANMVGVAAADIYIQFNGGRPPRASPVREPTPSSRTGPTTSRLPAPRSSTCTRTPPPIRTA